jgi:hypothetical protein
MNIFAEFKSVFKTPSPLQVAANELALAELELLSAESAVEYAVAMVSFNQSRVKRLKAYLVALASEN